MKRSKVHRLGDLQLQIMKVLWTRREATVAEVQQSLEGAKDLAYTTIATMLRKMEGRGLVRHRAEGRTFIYEALIEEEAVARNLADDLLDRLFEGSLADMVNHLLTARDVSKTELARIEKLVSEKKKSL